MDKENGIRLALTAAFGLFCAYFQVLVVPIGVLIGVMVLDYLTGMGKAWVAKELSSRIGITGILKKVGYLCIVAIAMVVDYLITSALASAGVILPDNFTVALLVIVWLIINELISILENLAIVGVPMPLWLTKLINKLKAVAEARGDDMVKKEDK